MLPLLCMKHIKVLILAILSLVFVIQSAKAETVYYQPTPYATTTTNGVHLYDGWITSVFYGKKFIQDSNLYTGGWGDTYRAYLQFDLKGLPQSVSTTTLWLKPFNGGGATTTSLDLYRVSGSWNTSMTWATQPSKTYVGQLSRPEYDIPWGVNISSLYTSWQNGTYSNYGLVLNPDYTNNKFSFFRSSRYTTTESDRPKLQFDYTPPVTLPDFKIPLPGDLSWLVTNETGGWECTNSSYDPYHDGINYFSLDFDDTNKDSGGSPQTTFTIGGSSTTSVPVVAAADGKVKFVGTNPMQPNGYYVVIDHDSDDNLNTGFSTRYLHLKYSPAVSYNDVVSQGDLLGYVGNTGTSTGSHLHFGMRYDGLGESTSTVQYAIIDDNLMKGVQTDCSGGSWNKYYPSSNTVY